MYLQSLKVSSKTVGERKSYQRFRMTVAQNWMRALLYNKHTDTHTHTHTGTHRRTHIHTYTDARMQPECATVHTNNKNMHTGCKYSMQNQMCVRYLIGWRQSPDSSMLNMRSAPVSAIPESLIKIRRRTKKLSAFSYDERANLPACNVV